MGEDTKKNKAIDPINSLILESENFKSMDVLEKLADQSALLVNFPVQPIYLALKTLTPEKVANYLPHFSPEQRQVFLDIDLWDKDEIDLVHFPFWVLAYAHSEDEAIKKEFVTSEQFLLYLKSKFNVWTFDPEDPNYPDHDHYFLTDDNMLLFEFDENFPFVSELRELIRHLYYELGVENAYTFLFKMVSDSFLTLEEEEYQKRKERLRDFGFVDYMDSLQMENPFISLEFVHKFIAEKKPYKVDLEATQINQNIHSSALTSFKDRFKSVIEELLKVDDQKRIDYLQFNFVRLINSRLEFDKALKGGSVAMNRSGAHLKNVILLGFHYLKSPDVYPLYEKKNVESLFSLFDFSEMYRIGNSLIQFNKKALKKSLAQNQFDSEANEAFLGSIWNEFLDNSLSSEVKVFSSLKEKSELMVDFEQYREWIFQTNTFIGLVPFIKKFHETFLKLKESGRIQDDYYLNYTIDGIDFEALFLSSFANFSLGVKNTEVPKLGLTILEFKKFIKDYINKDGKLEISQKNFTIMNDFFSTYGLSNVSGLSLFLQRLLKDNLEGYDYENLQAEDFKHVGGPIILNIQTH